MINEAVADDGTTTIVGSANVSTSSTTIVTLSGITVDSVYGITDMLINIRWYAYVATTASLKVYLSTDNSVYFELNARDSSVPAGFRDIAYAIPENQKSAVLGASQIYLKLVSTQTGSIDDKYAGTLYSSVYITQAFFEIAVNVLIGIPSDFQVQSRSVTGVTLSWTASQNNASYEVFRDNTYITTTQNQCYEDTLDGNEEHYYKVRGTKNGIVGEFTNVLCTSRICNYPIETLEVTALNVIPNPATINTSLQVSATVAESSRRALPETFMLNEFYGGEI